MSVRDKFTKSNSRSLNGAALEVASKHGLAFQVNYDDKVFWVRNSLGRVYPVVGEIDLLECSVVALNGSAAFVAVFDTRTQKIYVVEVVVGTE